MSKKRKQQDAQETAQIANDVKNHLADFEKKMAGIHAAEDSAQRIIKLQDLRGALLLAERDISDRIYSAVYRRRGHTAKSRLKKTGLILSILPIATAPIIACADWYSHASEKEIEQDIREKAGIAGFEQAASNLKERCDKMLDETVKDCDLNEISQSRHFADAFHRYEPLRKRFEAVAAARAALGEEPASPKTPANRTLRR